MRIPGVVLAVVAIPLAGCVAMRPAQQESPAGVVARPAADGPGIHVQATVYSGALVDGQNETLVLAPDGMVSYTTERYDVRLRSGPQRTEKTHRLAPDKLAGLDRAIDEAEFSTLPWATPAAYYSSGFRELQVTQGGVTRSVRIFPTYGNPLDDRQADELARAERVWDAVWQLREPPPRDP